MKSLINVRYNVYAPKAERNHVTHLNRATRTVYPLGSQFKLPRGTSSREQMRLLGHVITKQCCEIQSVGAFDLKRRCTVWSAGPEINTRPRAKCGWILQLAGKTVNLPATLAGSQWELSDSLVVVFLRLFFFFKSAISLDFSSKCGGTLLG